MGPEPHLLKANDFGDFEPELKGAFRDAFRFAWDVGPESLEEQSRRRAFAKIITAARSEPDTLPPRCREFVGKIHKLELELCDYLWPGDRLRDDLASVAAAISGIGDKISRLPATAFAQAGGSGLPSIGGIRSGWRVVESELRAARHAIPLTSPADEIMRLRAAGTRTLFEVRVVRDLLGTVSLPTKNSVNQAARTKDLNEVVASLHEVSETLKEFCEKCAPPPPEEATFRAYFARVVESLLIQSAPFGTGGVSALDCEVPLAALHEYRELPERRAAVLEWLCTYDPRFHPLLPSSARRDHLAPAITGGSGRNNWVLRGLTAALVLLELVEATGSEKRSGKALFKATVKRVERWIADRAATGHFYVDAADGERAPAKSRSMPLVARYMMKGRA